MMITKKVANLNDIHKFNREYIVYLKWDDKIKQCHFVVHVCINPTRIIFFKNRDIYIDPSALRISAVKSSFTFFSCPEIN